MDSMSGFPPRPEPDRSWSWLCLSTGVSCHYGAEFLGEQATPSSHRLKSPDKPCLRRTTLRSASWRPADSHVFEIAQRVGHDHAGSAYLVALQNPASARGIDSRPGFLRRLHGLLDCHQFQRYGSWLIRFHAPLLSSPAAVHLQIVWVAL
jgi:hypothetical protein